MPTIVYQCIIWLGQSQFPPWPIHHKHFCIISSCIVRKSNVSSSVNYKSVTGAANMLHDAYSSGTYDSLVTIPQIFRQTMCYDCKELALRHKMWRQNYGMKVECLDTWSQNHQFSDMAYLETATACHPSDLCSAVLFFMMSIVLLQFYEWEIYWQEVEFKKCKV